MCPGRKSLVPDHPTYTQTRGEGDAPFREDVQKEEGKFTEISQQEGMRKREIGGTGRGTKAIGLGTRMARVK